MSLGTKVQRQRETKMRRKKRTKRKTAMPRAKTLSQQRKKVCSVDNVMLAPSFISEQN